MNMYGQKLLRIQIQLSGWETSYTWMKKFKVLQN